MEKYSIFFIIFWLLLLITLILIVYNNEKKSDSLKRFCYFTTFACAVFFISSVSLYFQKKPVQTTISPNTIEPTISPVTDEKFIHSENTSENYQDEQEETYDY